MFLPSNAKKPTVIYIQPFWSEAVRDYIAFYDKEQKSSMIYSGYDFIKETSLNGLSKVITTYNDTFVATINPDVLKEKGTTIEELAQLSQSLPAESNPILCLFTFK